MDGATVLVVGDDPEIAQLPGDFLVVEGFQVRSTPNPGEAVAALATNGIE
jgi:DNA-binding response OmpR family regulator